MRAAPLPQNEPARLEALARYEVLDTPPEQDFDDLTLLASHICKTPQALISLVDRERQWFKSRVGVEQTETPRPRDPAGRRDDCSRYAEGRAVRR